MQTAVPDQQRVWVAEEIHIPGTQAEEDRAYLKEFRSYKKHKWSYLPPELQRKINVLIPKKTAIVSRSAHTRGFIIE